METSGDFSRYKTQQLRQLRWLPICFQEEFKVMIPTYKALNGLVPSYLKIVHSFMSVDHFMNFLKRIQADILMITTKDGFFMKESEMYSRDFLVQVPEGYRTFLKERFNFVNVPGNHYVHLNEPEVVAGIISTFINKDLSPKARL